MANVLDTLSEVSGLGRPAVDSILGCVYRDYRCANCGGKIDSHAERWYRLGLEHAKT